MRFFLDNICTKEWNENQDAGYPIKQATSDLIKKHPKYLNEINDNNDTIRTLIK